MTDYPTGYPPMPPKDLAGDHFPPDFRHMQAQPAVKAVRIDDSEQRIAALEAALAKQRAVNEALEGWFDERHRVKGLAAAGRLVLTALREAMK